MIGIQGEEYLLTLEVREQVQPGTRDDDDDEEDDDEYPDNELVTDS